MDGLDEIIPLKVSVSNSLSEANEHKELMLTEVWSYWKDNVLKFSELDRLTKEMREHKQSLTRWCFFLAFR